MRQFFLQGGAAVGLHQQVRAVLSVFARHNGRRRAEPLPVLPDACLLRAVAGEGEGLQGAFGVGMAGEQRHLCAVRRQLRPRALFVEAAGGIFVGVVQDGEDGMLRLARLYPDLSLAFASGAAADLHQ